MAVLRASAALAQSCIAADTAADILSIISSQNGYALICLSGDPLQCALRLLLLQHALHSVTRSRFCTHLARCRCTIQYLCMCFHEWRRVTAWGGFRVFCGMLVRTSRPPSVIDLCGTNRLCRMYCILWVYRHSIVHPYVPSPGKGPGDERVHPQALLCNRMPGNYMR